MSVPSRESVARQLAALEDLRCGRCGRESCAGECPPVGGLDPALLTDAVDVAREGQAIEQEGVRYVVERLIPAYGLVGFLVGYAKAGKSTFGQALAAAVAHGRPFLDLATEPTRVLVIAAEDPPEYVAYCARHLDVPTGSMTFFRGPILFDTPGLAAIHTTVSVGNFGLVLVSSWQAVVRGLIRDENDNAGAVAVIEGVKVAARATGVPWLVDAHSGKGEDGADDADPTRAMRGASAAAGAADFLLSLRYSDTPFGTRRRLSGKGRFVNVPTLTIDFDAATSNYSIVAQPKSAQRESTWRLICEMGALDDTPRSLQEIAVRAGLVDQGIRLDGNQRRQLFLALADRPDVGRADGLRRGRKTTLYRRLDGAA